MKTSKLLKIIGLLPIGLLALVSLVFGIGESAGGDISGLVHLVQFVILGLTAWFCWKWPYWGGMILLAVTLFRVLALIPELFLRPAGSVWDPSLFILPLVQAISGGLFLYAGLSERKAASANLP